MNDLKEMQQVLMETMDPELIPYIERVGGPGPGYPFVIFNFGDNAVLLQKVTEARSVKRDDSKLEEKKGFPSHLTVEAVLWLKSQGVEEKKFCGRILDIDPFPVRQAEEEDEEECEENFQLELSRLYEYVAADGTVYVEDVKAFWVRPLDSCYCDFIAIRRAGDPDGWIPETLFTKEQLAKKRHAPFLGG